LRLGNEEDAHVSFFGDIFANAVDMGFLACEGDAGAYVEAPLQHLEAVRKKEFAKISGAFALFLGADGEVKSYEEPTHFVFSSNHGL